MFSVYEKPHREWIRRISLFNHEIEVPHVPLREKVELHLIPHRQAGDGRPHLVEPQVGAFRQSSFGWFTSSL